MKRSPAESYEYGHRASPCAMLSGPVQVCAGHATRSDISCNLAFTPAQPCGQSDSMSTSLSLYCFKHMRPVLDTTVDEASAMGATTSNHAIETIPQVDTTIFVVDYGSWTTPYAPGKGLVARAGLCWPPTGAWPSRSEPCAPDVMIECNAQFRRPLWLATVGSGV